MSTADAELFGELWFGKKERKLTAEQKDALALWGGDCWTFLTGAWPLPRHVAAKGSEESRPLVWTNDPHEQKIRPFPHYEYLRRGLVEPITQWPHGTEGRELPPLVVDKPRQQIVTTAILLTIAWEVLFREAVQWLIAKNKWQEAQDLIVEKMRFAYKRLPSFLRRARPIKTRPAGRFDCDITGSIAKAVGQNFGQSESKGSTADVFIDEGPLLKNLEPSVEAAQAMARRVIIVGTPPEDGRNPEAVRYYHDMITGAARSRDRETIVGAPDEEPDWAPQELAL